jgi:ATP-dependent Clp protease adaptor protein ClpS
MPEKHDDATSPAAAPTVAATKPRANPKRKQLPPFHVILLDDDDHTYAYVIEMLGDVFGYNIDKSLGMAEEVDAQGRVIVFTTHREHAELKRDQILRYGADPRDDNCKGSMSAVIEPAE